MLDIKRTIIATQKDWAQLKEAANEGVLDKHLQSGDEIDIVLKRGESVTFVVGKDERRKIYFILKNPLADLFPISKKITTDKKMTWKDSDMRKYLNNRVFALLPDDLQAVIKPTTIVQIVNGEEIKTRDELFCLSATQVLGKKETYEEIEPNDSQIDIFLKRSARIADVEDYHSRFWWLRTPREDRDEFYYVSDDGNKGTNFHYLDMGIVFAFTL